MVTSLVTAGSVFELSADIPFANMARHIKQLDFERVIVTYRNREQIIQ